MYRCSYKLSGSDPVTNLLLGSFTTIVIESTTIVIESTGGFVDKGMYPRFNYRKLYICRLSDVLEIYVAKFTSIEATLISVSSLK